MGYWKWAHACAGGPWHGRHDHDDDHGRGGPRWRRHHPMGHRRRGGGMGVRRPLRYLSRRLDLSDDQIETMAALLDTLKTERAQADVDNRRALGAIADAMLADVFDETAVREATTLRVESRRRVEAAVVETLAKTFALLDPEQRKQLAYLLRAGELTI